MSSNEHTPEEIRRRWVEAAFFDLEAEILRQGETLEMLQRLCQGKDAVRMAELGDSLGRLRKGNAAMRDIINNVHNIHEDAQRAAVLEEKPHDLKIFLERFREIALKKTRAANVGLRCPADSLRDTAVLFDGDTVNQILGNLLTYAMQATDAGGRIIFRAKQAEESRPGCGTYLFEFTGTGMGEVEIEKVLGLTVVKQLAERMGGCLRSGAAAGSGYSIGVELPLLFVSHEAGDRFVAEKRILVVDDNVLNSELVADLLREAGAIVEIVASGEEAVDMVSNYYEGYYDIVLTDIQMTGIDGYETARLIREIPWATKDALKIIALSSFAYDPVKDREEGSCFNAYCMKPFDIRSFAAAAFGEA